MKKKNLGLQIIAMLSVFILAVLILSKAFIAAGERSREASKLSYAVTLASDGADVFLSAKDEEEMFAVLNEENNAVQNKGIDVYYDDDLKADRNGSFRMEIRTKEGGGFIEADIMVYHGDELIYSLNTGKEAEE